MILRTPTGVRRTGDVRCGLLQRIWSHSANRTGPLASRVHRGVHQVLRHVRLTAQ